MFLGLSTCRLLTRLTDKLPCAGAAGLVLALAHGAIPAFAQSNAAASDIRIPPVLLHYKYAPTDFSDQYLLEQARRQISADAYVHSIGKQRRPGHVLMFSSDQVAGRDPAFAAEDLLPFYKQRWAALARSIPDQLHFSADVNLDYLTYENGALRAKQQDRKSNLHQIDGLSEQTKLRLPPLGRTEVLDFLPRLSGAMAPQLPSSVTQAPAIGGFRLALDRALHVPPVTMERAAAERLWRRPECSPFVDSGLRDAGVRRAAQEAAARCGREIAAFKPRITIVFDVQTEGVIADGANRIVRAKLVGATVLGSRMEPLKTLSASDFPEAVDSWQAQADRKAVEARRTAALQSAQEESRLAGEKTKDAARTAARAALLKADTVGIRLGMTLVEAEQVIRGRLNLGWVASSKPPSRPIVQSDWIRNPRTPYSEFRIFGTADAEEQIVLFSHAGVSDRVMGVVRSVQLQAGVTGEMVVKQLLEKYGKDPIFIHKPTANTNYSATLAWMVDFGQPCDASGSDPASCIRVGSCHTTLTNIGSYQLSVVEPTGNAGELLRDVANPQSVAPILRVWGAESEDRRTWDAGKWRGCGPTVLADIYPNAKPPVLNVAIFNLAEYADVYLKAMPDPKVSAGKPPDL